MKSFFVFIFFVSLTTISYAKSQNHSHAGRSHSHPLPVQGLAHRHGNSAIGKNLKNNHTSTTKLYSKNKIEHKTLNSKNGKYVGQVLNNKKHGKGTYYHSSGNKFVGQWKNDKRNGQGITYWRNGDKFTGEFRDDKIYQGKLVDKNGKILNKVTFTRGDGSKYMILDGRNVTEFGYRNNSVNVTTPKVAQKKVNKPAISGVSKYIARDQNNCIHYVKYPKEGITYRVKWTGKCVNGYAKGAGKRTWFSNGKQDGSTRWIRKASAKSSIDREIAYKKKKEQEKNEVVTRKSQMLNFVNKYNLRSILSPNPKSNSSWDVDGAADWSSAYDFPTMDTAGKTGKIYLTFGYKRKRYEGRIYGKFVNGALVGEGSVNIERTIDGSCGFWSCESISKNYEITASSDIRAKLLSGAAYIAPQLGPAARRVARQKAAKASSSSSYSSSSQKYGCKFYCEGSFGARKSPRFQENTPMTNSSDAQKYIKDKWDSKCSKNYSGAYGVNIPSCETYYYE